MFKVTHAKVKCKGKIYGQNEEAGDMISGLSSEQEERLRDKGYGEIISSEKTVKDEKEEVNNIYQNITTMNVRSVQKLITKTDDLEDLKKFQEIELANKNRKTVLEPLEEKIDEIEMDEEEQENVEDVNVKLDVNDVIIDGEK